MSSAVRLFAIQWFLSVQQHCECLIQEDWILAGLWKVALAVHWYPVGMPNA